MTDFQRALHEATQRARKEEQEKKVDVMIRIMSALYDKATTYTNLVIIAGYAAFFTVWGIMKNRFPKGKCLPPHSVLPFH